MEKEILIGNFLRMAPQIPQYSQKNQNYLIANADPLYYLMDNSQEEQVAPLIASETFSLIGSTAVITGNITEMIDGGDSIYDVIVADDKWFVYGVTHNGAFQNFVANFPVTGGNTNGTPRLALFNKKIVWSAYTPYSTFLFYVPYSGIGGWVNISSGLTGQGVKYLEPFLEYLFFNDGSKIKKLASDMVSITTSFDFGSNWTVMGIKNFNDKYLAIAASTNPYTVNNNYLFLYDGIANRPNYSVKMNGMFQDMYVSGDGTLYVLVQERNNHSVLYYLSGTRLKRVQSIAIDSVSLPATTNATGNILFNYGGLLGVRLTSKGNLLLGSSDSGEAEFILSKQSATKLLNASTGILFLASAGTVYFYTGGVSGISTRYYSELDYQTQWIPIKNLQAINIYHDSLPVSGTDAIKTTVYGQGEDIITGSSTTVLDDITASNYLTIKRTRLDVKGFTGDQVMLKLTTINDTWRPIIRAIGLIIK